MKRKPLWVGIVLAALTSASAWAADLPREKPEALGFSADRLDAIDRFYENKVHKGEMAGMVILIARHGKIAHLSAVGYADIEKKEKMKTDAIFRIETMTKPLAATALMMLYEEGRFQLSDPLSKYIPEFANLRVLRNPDGPLDDTVPMQREPTVEDVLRHTAGFTTGAFPNAFDAQYMKADILGLDITLKEMTERLAKIPLRYQPGTRWSYSLAPDIQARLVEVMSGMPFDQFLEKRLFQPLGMKETSYVVSSDNAKRVPPIYWFNKQGKLVPLDDAHGGPANPMFKPAYVNNFTANPKRKGGIAGLLSTTADYWRFAQMLLNGGVLDGARILSPHTIKFMASDHLHTLHPGSDMPLKDLADIGFAGIGFGLGLGVMEDPVAAGYTSSEGEFFWSGGAQTYCWMDPKEDLVVMGMPQQYWTQEEGGDLLSLFKELHALVYGALME